MTARHNVAARLAGHLPQAAPMTCAAARRDSSIPLPTEGQPVTESLTHPSAVGGSTGPVSVVAA